MKLPRLIWVDENNEPTSLRSWFRSLFAKPPPPPEPGTVAWIAAQDTERLRRNIAKSLASNSPYLSLLKGGKEENTP